MGVGWSAEFTDFVTGRVIERDVPLVVSSFDVGIGVANGGLGGFLPFADLPKPASQLLLAGKTVIWICWGGTPIGAPYLLTGKPRITQDGTGHTVTAVSAGEVFKRRKLYADMVFDQQDVFDIVRAVGGYGIGDLTHLGAVVESFRDRISLPSWAATGYTVPWLRFGGGDSGITRSVADDPNTGYLAIRDLSIEPLLTALAVEAGFEMKLDAGRDDQGLYGQLTLGAPTVGRATETVLQVQWPGDVNWAYGEDTSNMVTAAAAFGTGTTGGRVRGDVMVDEQAIADGFPIWFPASSPATSATDPATLRGYATGVIVANRGVNEGFEVVLDESAIGQISVGDGVHGLFEHEMFPGGRRDVDLRVLSIRYEPATGQVVPSLKRR